MTSASTLRIQLESALAHKIPSALTPPSRMVRPTTLTGIPAVDTLLEGGLPVGALTEIVGAESSGRTSLALSSLAQLTSTGKVCAWVDVSDTLKPECAAAVGIALPYLLWVRCGVFRKGVPLASTLSRFELPQSCLARPKPVKGLHGGGCGTHPRQESKSVAQALEGFFGTEKPSSSSTANVPQHAITETTQLEHAGLSHAPLSPWARIEQALKVTDLLLQAGGFSAVVLDMASLPAEYTSKIPLSHWFRYRAAAEHAQTAVLLLTQSVCTNSSAALQLRLGPPETISAGNTVFAGHDQSLHVKRRRFMRESNVIPMKKPPARATDGRWASRASWAGRR